MCANCNIWHTVVYLVYISAVVAPLHVRMYNMVRVSQMLVNRILNLVDFLFQLRSINNILKNILFISRSMYLYLFNKLAKKPKFHNLFMYSIKFSNEATQQQLINTEQRYVCIYYREIKYSSMYFSFHLTS